MKHQYSDGIHHKRVALFGPLPPPLGGVSVHVERVIAKLRNQNNVVCHFNTTSELRYKKLFGLFLHCIRMVLFVCIHRPQILIYHTSYLHNAIFELRLLVMMKKIFCFKLLLIEHDCRFAHALTVHQKQHYKIIVQSADTQIFIGTKTKHSFVTTDLCAYSTQLEAAFLPPDTSNAQQLRAAYPPSLFVFLQSHSPIIMANAFQLSMLDGKDLYGFDQLVCAFALSQAHIPSAGLVLMLAQKGDEKLFKQLIEYIEQHHLTDHVYILLGNHVLWPLFEYADLFVRPTLSDGASVSVQEALHFGVPVIASDVCWRPANCVLYKAGDHDALYKSIKGVLF